MAQLHLSKVAFGCTEVVTLRDRLAGRAVGGETYIDTRYRPTRHAELIGGSLFWIIKHQLVARSRILRFDESEDKRCLIRLEPELVTVIARPKRAHQGWRYLTAGKAPGDLGVVAEGCEEMPSDLLGELAALGLV